MAFGSNIALPAFLKPSVGDNPALDYQMGKDAGKLRAQRRVADAMRGIGGDYNSMSDADLGAKLDRLKTQRDELMGQLTQVEGEEAQSQSRRDAFGNIISAPFRGIQSIVDKIRNGTATEEEVAQVEAETPQGYGGGEATTGMEGYTPLFPDRSMTGTSRYDRSTSPSGTVMGGDILGYNEIDAPEFAAPVGLFGRQPDQSLRPDPMAPTFSADSNDTEGVHMFRKPSPSLRPRSF